MASASIMLSLRLRPNKIGQSFFLLNTFFYKTFLQLAGATIYSPSHC